MKPHHFFTGVLITVASATYAADKPTTLIEKGDVGPIVVDNAPGSVSAMAALGITADQTTVVQNPRNLTIALKALDGKNAFGLSLTPARTSLVPLSVNDYYSSNLARLWGATTFSYAQGRNKVGALEFERRAYSVETSYIFFPEEDDPIVMYWLALETAGTVQDAKNPCFIHSTATKPSLPQPQQPPGAMPSTDGPAPMIAEPALAKDLDKRAQQCRDGVAEKARWNVSRAWASVSAGQYQPVDGGDHRSLGRTYVAGITWGIGKVGAKTATAITLAAKRSIDSPVLSTMGNVNPDRKSSSIAVARIAVGSAKLRLLLEGSNVKNTAPTATDRTFKQALGIDVKVADDWWLNLRSGKQRRIDNKGNENASSFSISYSPKAILAL